MITDRVYRVILDDAVIDCFCPMELINTVELEGAFSRQIRIIVIHVGGRAYVCHSHD